MRSLIDASDEEMDRAFERERTSNQQRAGDTALPENDRLVLQCLADKGGTSSGFPMWLEPNGLPATLIERLLPQGSGGTVSWRITQEGEHALSEANARLGDRATRYVHHLKTFGSLKPVVYGYPFLIPLSQPVWNYEGRLVADKPPLRYRWWGR